MHTLPNDILTTFNTLFAEAQAAGEPDRTAMTVASVDAQGRPSARIVLLKHHDAQGFVFYTHLDGRKGHELQAHPQAALLFYWPRVRNGVQVRLEGAVEIVSVAEADAYFASRPRESQLGAWASLQSEPLPDRETFEARYAEVEARYAGTQVPRPPHWSGYRVVPDAIEFWYGVPYRLHDRHAYRRVDGTWTRGLLYP